MKFNFSELVGKPTNTKRDLAIARKFLEGATPQELAGSYSLTPERVRVIVKTQCRRMCPGFFRGKNEVALDELRDNRKLFAL